MAEAKKVSPEKKMRERLRKADYELKAKYYSGLLRTQSQRINMAKTPKAKATAQRKLKRLQISLAAAKARAMGRKPKRNTTVKRRRKRTATRTRTSY